MKVIGIHRIASAIALAVLLAAAPAWAEADAKREYQIKAAFLFNFVQFVEWPAESFDGEEAPYVLAVLGEDPFGDLLDQTVRDKTVNGRSLVVRRFRTLDDLGPCHLLFVSKSEDGRLDQLFERLGSAPVLTVGETDAFPWAGGMLRFYTAENKIRFEVNLKAVQRTKLKISSKLLKLARIFGK